MIKKIPKIKIPKIIIENVVLIGVLVGILFLPFNTFGQIFSIKDDAHDDVGAGKIKYPTNQLFQKKDLFDIRKYEVYQEKGNVCFKFDIGNLAKDVDFANGFSYILVDDYISFKGDKGLFDTIRYGAAVSFNRDYPWQYHMKITPKEAYIEKVTDVNKWSTERVGVSYVNGKKLEKVSEKVKASLDVKGNSLIFSVDKNYFKGEKLKNAAYYVFSGAYDMFGPDGYRLVNKKVSEWYLGDGADGYCDPNVLDVVHPEQESMLNLYVPPGYAIISPVHNQLLQKYLYKEYFIVLWIASVAGVNYKFLKRRREAKAQKEDVSSDVVE